MKRVILILLLLIVAAPAFAAPKKPCPKGCAHRAKSAACVQPAPATPALWSAVVDGFTLTAGFRWQLESECPTLIVPDPPEEPSDPFYVGAEIHLPLSPRAGVFGAFDRDFTDAAHWQVRTGISFRPFGGTP